MIGHHNTSYYLSHILNLVKQRFEDLSVIQLWNSSSVEERGIAGPKVTGSIPVYSFSFEHQMRQNFLMI